MEGIGKLTQPRRAAFNPKASAFTPSESLTPITPTAREAVPKPESGTSGITVEGIVPASRCDGMQTDLDGRPVDLAFLPVRWIGNRERRYSVTAETD